jgi:hypothetical protein
MTLNQPTVSATIAASRLNAVLVKYIVGIVKIRCRESTSTFQIKITAQNADSPFTKAIARTFQPIILTETLTNWR